MAPTRYVRAALRAVGLDLTEHVAGARRVPVRLQRQLAVGPLAGRRRIPEAFEVEVAACTSFAGFPYDPTDWNPLVETLREHEADASLTYEASTLGRLHERFRPATLQELWFGPGHEPLPPLDVLPVARAGFRYVWELSPATVARLQASGARSENYFFGPIDPERGRAEFERLVAAYRSIRDQGFQPDRYGHVTGYLIGDERRHRFVIGSGNHRVAALAALGIATLPVRLHSHPAVIHRSQLASWTTERGGPFEPATATALFEQLLTGTGQEKAAAYDLA